MPHLRVIGPGRAGRSLAAALELRGWRVEGLLDRHAPPAAVASAAVGVDALVIATPDDAVATVAGAVRPDPQTPVLHLAGSLGLDALDPHPRRAALHPLVPLPTPELGARRLTSGITFAVAGDPVARQMAEALGGQVVEVGDQDRAVYHAAATIAANHVVAVLGQVERVAASAGLPFDAFLALTRAAIDDVARLGPAGALTGPVARGDWSTVGRHRDALAPEERPGYHAGVALAFRLATQRTAPPGAQPQAQAAQAAPTEAPDVGTPGPAPASRAAAAAPGSR